MSADHSSSIPPETIMLREDRDDGEILFTILIDPLDLARPLDVAAQDATVASIELAFQLNNLATVQEATWDTCPVPTGGPDLVRANLRVSPSKHRDARNVHAARIAGGRAKPGHRPSNIERYIRLAFESLLADH